MCGVSTRVKSKCMARCRQGKESCKGSTWARTARWLEHHGSAGAAPPLCVCGVAVCPCTSVGAVSHRSLRPSTGRVLSRNRFEQVDSLRPALAPVHSNSDKPREGRVQMKYRHVQCQMKEQGREVEIYLRSSHNGPSRVAQLKPCRIGSFTVFRSLLSTCCR